MDLEHKILKHLVYDKRYTRTVLPFLKKEYFTQNAEIVLFEEICKYIHEYKSNPTKETLLIQVDKNTSLSEVLHKDASNLIEKITENSDIQDSDWLIDTTEKFCKQKAIYNGLMQSIQIVDETDKERNRLDLGAIPKILTDALAVSFDNHIGHDLVEDAEQRHEYYHLVEKRVPFDIEMLNKITKGGVPEKSLNVILAGTGVGKSLFMCHCASANMAMGKNVLYITLEMSEERIAERVDANLMNVKLDDLVALPKDIYMKKIERIREKTAGKLIIKEYPTATANPLHFKRLLDELRLKKQFIPDIIYVDYINICTSSRIKPGSNANSYTYVKAIAEELRGLAVEYSVPIISATQSTRSGYTNTDVGLEDTSESFGLPATADFMFAIISSDQLSELNQVLIKQLKNRYSDPNKNKRFIVGIDKPKMRIYDVEQTAQEDVLDSGQTETKQDKFKGFKV
tara:strand:+ start:947 stop:2314 length:1368 start_codon:yes stop_codon:yes gene_type:complete